MPIRIVTCNKVSAPVVLCEVCKERINSVQDGNVDWRAIDISEPKFTHKGCSSTFRNDQPYVHESMQLAAFIVGLASMLPQNDRQ
jgi:hypothetical protein